MASLSAGRSPLANHALLPLGLILALAALAILPATSYAQVCQSGLSYVQLDTAPCSSQCPAESVVNHFLVSTSVYQSGQVVKYYYPSGTRAPSGDGSVDACCRECQTTFGCQSFAYIYPDYTSITLAYVGYIDPANGGSGTGCYTLTSEQCADINYYTAVDGADAQIGVLGTLCASAQAPAPPPPAPPLIASCNADVQLSATSGCSATPNVADVDKGSTAGATLSLFPTGPLSLGIHDVTLTVADATTGESATCVSHITVSDKEPLDFNLITCPGFPSPAPVISPSQASTATFNAAYNGGASKKNGCPVTVAVPGTCTCDRCNSAGKHVKPDCQTAVLNGNQVRIAASGGNDNHISWTTTVTDGKDMTSQKCGVCVGQPDKSCKSPWVPGNLAPCS